MFYHCNHSLTPTLNRLAHHLLPYTRLAAHNPDGIQLLDHVAPTPTELAAHKLHGHEHQVGLCAAQQIQSVSLFDVLFHSNGLVILSPLPKTSQFSANGLDSYFQIY